MNTSTHISQDSLINLSQIREDFPILSRQVNGKPLVYLDNGATSQKPVQVLNAMDQYYREINSNVHRGVHTLSQLATEAYEASREKLRGFINAAESREIIFTKGTTSAINTVAFSFAKKHLKSGDEILISGMEHHSNIVPWQMVCEEKGAILKVIPVTDSGELDYDAFLKLLNPKVKLLAFTHISNVLGTVNPVKEMIAEAHKNGTLVLIDGAQSVPHQRIDVQDLDCDFFCFSGHKMYGPTGIGVLYGKAELLNSLPPFEGGGDMIKEVSFEKTTYADIPFRFEAGTPNIAGAIGLAAAVNYMENLGIEIIQKQEQKLLEFFSAQLSEIEGLKIYGTSKNKASVISFLIEGAHPYDLGMILDKKGIAIRTGHHCAQPLMDRFKIPGTARASMAFYNTFEEADQLCEAIIFAKKLLGV